MQATQSPPDLSLSLPPLHTTTGNSITPGTRFMLDLSLSLMSWASSRLAANKYAHLQIEVSDATVKVCEVLTLNTTWCVSAPPSSAAYKCTHLQIEVSDATVKVCVFVCL